MQFHIGISEMLYNVTLPSLNELLRNEEDFLFSSRLSIQFRVMKDFWFERKPDEYFQKFAETRQPFLLIHGEMDPQTPHSHGVYYFNRVKRSPFQYFISFPNYVHKVLFHQDQDCSQKMLVEFVKNPTRKPNDSCILSIPKIDFEGKRSNTKLISKNLFGVEDLWYGL
jgi:pimeloyl-ACP methyl ester carboxylesterase